MVDLEDRILNYIINSPSKMPLHQRFKTGSKYRSKIEKYKWIKLYRKLKHGNRKLRKNSVEESKHLPVSLQVPQHSQRINSIRSYINEQIDIALTSYNSYTTRASFDGHRYSYNNNLDNLFPVSSLIAQTVYSQKYLNTDEEGKLISITLLKDRIYQLYNKYLKLEERMIENAKQIAIRSAGDPNKFPGADAPTEAFWNTYFRLLYNCKKEFSGYAKEIPGFQAINEIDLDYLMRERCFFMYSLKITDLVIDNECYSIEDGIQLSKKWISVSFDSKLAEEAIKFHNRLKKFNLSKSQIALIFPIILTSPLSE